MKIAYWIFTILLAALLFVSALPDVLMVDGAVQIFNVVRNRVLAILARHPTGDDGLIVAGVETMQRLHRDLRPLIRSGNAPQLVEHGRRVLSVAMTADKKAA